MGSAGSSCWSQTPPSSLRDATAPNRGGLGKEGKLYAMPRAPLLGGLSPQATGGFSRQLLLESNPTVIPAGCHLP